MSEGAVEARVGIGGRGDMLLLFLSQKKWVVPQTAREALPEVDTNVFFK